MAGRTVRIEDLIRSKVLTSDGTNLGKVVDLELSNDGTYRVENLVMGLGGWLARMDILRVLAAHSGRVDEAKLIPWSAVESFEGLTVRLKPGWEGDRDTRPTESE